VYIEGSCWSLFGIVSSLNGRFVRMTPFFDKSYFGRLGFRVFENVANCSWGDNCAAEERSDKASTLLQLYAYRVASLIG